MEDKNQRAWGFMCNGRCRQCVADVFLSSLFILRLLTVEVSNNTITFLWSLYLLHGWEAVSEAGRERGGESVFARVCVSLASFVCRFLWFLPVFGHVPRFLVDPAQIKTKKTTNGCASMCWCLSASLSFQETAVSHSQPLAKWIPANFAQI